MNKLTVKEIINACNVKSCNLSPDLIVSGISTDSRNVAVGDLFVALEGERFDGHQYATDAIKAGAVGVLGHKDNLPCNGIVVENSLTALGDIAAYYRSKMALKVAAVTGSAGKTTTKEMLYCALSQKYDTLKNKGNLNNQIGVPKTVFELTDQHQAAVFELGMNSFGEISALSEIVKPDAAVITNIGTAHIERLGSREGIYKAKTEICHGMRESSLLVLNGDDDMLWNNKESLPNEYITYGYANRKCDILAENIRFYDDKTEFSVSGIDRNSYTICINAKGYHNVSNALGAYSAAVFMGVACADAAAGISNFVPDQNRQSIKNIMGAKVIDDTYNANPESVKAALAVLKEFEGRKIAVLGEMLELGDFSPSAHRSVGKAAAFCNIDRLYVFGEAGKYISEGAINGGMDSRKVLYFDTKSQLSTQLKADVTSGDVILVKGSRGIKMETVIDFLSAEKNS